MYSMVILSVFLPNPYLKPTKLHHDSGWLNVEQIKRWGTYIGYDVDPIHLAFFHTLLNQLVDFDQTFRYFFGMGKKKIIFW